MKIEQIISEIYQNLEEIAKELLSQQIKEEERVVVKEAQQKFLREIDSPSQHQPLWHQWGIITHTYKFIEFYDYQIQEDFKKWNISKQISKYLSHQIDGIPKSKLIYLGILFHDIGKFYKNYIEISPDKVRYNFKNHENYSYRVIKNELTPLLLEYNLTSQQIEYIAKCAKYHFELGILREEAKKSSTGYTLDFVESSNFQDIILASLSEFGEFSVEIGILFLADSYAKTDIDYRFKSDNELLDILKSKKLNPKLIASIKQLKINIEVVKSYFNILFTKKERE